MRIGTDISTHECKAEGYTVIDFKVRGLYPHGRGNPIDRDFYVRIIQSVPEWINSDPFRTNALDVRYSFNELLEVYLQDKDEIDSFCGLEVYSPKNVNPNEYDLLKLADSIIPYKGLE